MLTLTLTLISVTSLSARSDEIVCVICFGIHKETAVGAGSWCRKWNRARKNALTFTDDQIAVLRRDQREAFKSIKRDLRRECPDKERGK